jgi:hypothetical protein
MEAYLDPSRISAAARRPSFAEMMRFCEDALRRTPQPDAAGSAADIRLTVVE